MTTIVQLFATGTALAGLLALIAIGSPRRLALKVVALVAMAGFLPLGYLSLVELLGRPKPITWELWLSTAEEATVLGSLLEEGQGIHLWLQLPGLSEPRAVVLPWDRTTAEQLQEARRQAENGQGELRIRLPFQPSLDDDQPRFYAPPQPALPPKDLADPGPRRVEPAADAS